MGRCLAYPNEKSSFWWWWRATRISPDANSITEFPFFSFLLGDLHPHVMAIPFVFTVVGLGLALFRDAEPLTGEFWRRRPLVLLVSALLLGGLGFLNTWDLPTFGFLLALLVVARNLIDRKEPLQALKHAGSFLLPLVPARWVTLLALLHQLQQPGERPGGRAQWRHSSHPQLPLLGAVVQHQPAAAPGGAR